MNYSIKNEEAAALMNSLQKANLAFQKKYPGDKPERQAVHTMYGGANIFKSDTTIKMGEIALRNFKTYAPDFVSLAKILQLKGHENLPHSQIDIHS
ncbi:MAG: phosphoenolpyruvate kinase, partial [Ginsengibacter sp.]